MSSNQSPKPNKPSLRSAISFRKIAIEVSSIVLGVLLALWLNEWRSNVNADKLTRNALIHVREELEWNQEYLSELHPRNQAVVDKVKANAELGEKEGVLPGLQIQDTAWKAFQDAGSAGSADFELMLSLSKPYAIQQVYRDSGLQIAQAAMNHMAYAAAMGKPADDHAFSRNFAEYLGYLVDAEVELLKSYDISLRALASVLGPEPNDPATDTESKE